MNEPIKILHVVGRMDRGGTEALLMSLLRELDKEEFCYDFVEQTNDRCQYDDEIESLGAKIYRCPTISPKNLKKYRQWWRTFFLEHPEYKIIHGHSRGSGPIYMDEAKKAGRIVIAHCHSNSFGRGWKGIVRRIWQMPLHKIADYNFACSYDSGISQYGKNGKFEVINNGIQTKEYVWNLETRKKVRKSFKIDDKYVVGHVGRFIDAKNHIFMLNIFHEIKKIRKDAVLMLVGEGPLESEVRNHAQKLGIVDSIIFTGVRPDVNELLQAMDVFVLPSIFEGLGIVNVEAQAAGLPCFTSETVVPPEVKLTDLLHFISLEQSSEYWAKYIIEHSISIEDRRNTYDEIVRSGYDIQTSANKLNAFYKEISS